MRAVSLLVLAACGSRAPSPAPAPVTNASADLVVEPPSCEHMPPQPQAPPPPVCGDFGCNNGLTIALDRAGPWPPGSYELEIRADEVSQQCTSVIPFRSCDMPVHCTGDRVAEVETSDCGGTDDGFADLRLGEGFCHFFVTITRDGTTVADGAYAPRYDWFEPNGPGCEPQCLQAREVLEVR